MQWNFKKRKEMQKEFTALNKQLPSTEVLNSAYIIINWNFLHLFK